MVVGDAAKLGLDALMQRAAPDGGFTGQVDGQVRPDASAWAALALALHGAEPARVRAACAGLAAAQLEDGRVPARSENPEAVWPTPLALLAWHHTDVEPASRERATDFLLNATGQHWERTPETPFGHDPSIRGWPWITDTHSWVEPTSLAMLALRSVGRGEHPRVREGQRMLMDRQLDAGGWNFGNTTVLGQTLRPFPDSTGIALCALSGRVESDRVRTSLDWLRAALSGMRTPLAIGWGVLGLTAWGSAPAEAISWLDETLTRPGAEDFDSAHLALLLVAWAAALEGRLPLLEGERHAA